MVAGLFGLQGIRMCSHPKVHAHTESCRTHRACSNQGRHHLLAGRLDGEGIAQELPEAADEVALVVHLRRAGHSQRVLARQVVEPAQHEHAAPSHQADNWQQRRVRCLDKVCAHHGPKGACLSSVAGTCSGAPCSFQSGSSSSSARGSSTLPDRMCAPVQYAFP